MISLGAIDQETVPAWPMTPMKHNLFHLVSKISDFLNLFNPNFWAANSRTCVRKHIREIITKESGGLCEFGLLNGSYVDIFVSHEYSELFRNYFRIWKPYIFKAFMNIERIWSFIFAQAHRSWELPLSRIWKSDISSS